MSGDATAHRGTTAGAPAGEAAAIDFAAVLAAVPVATAVFAADAPRFTLLVANDALRALVGGARAELTGLRLAEAFPDPEPDAPAGSSGLVSLRASLTEAVRTGRPQAMTRQRYDLQRPDGTWEARYWDATNVPVRAPDGTVRWIIHQAEDVTQRVREAEALARAERQASRVLGQVSDAHITLDRDYRVVAVNPAAERVLGLSRDAMLGRTHWELFPTSHDAEAGRAYRRVAEEGVEQHLRQHYVDAHYDVQVEIDAYPTDDGGVDIFWRDVTAQWKVEQENAWLAAVVNASGEAMFGLTLDGIIRTWNPAAERLLGWTAGEIVGQSVRTLAPPGRHEEQRAIFAAVQAGQTQSVETVRLAKGGVPVDVLLTTGPVRDAAGTPIGISAVLVDMRARKRAEAEQQRARREAEAARERAERLQALTEALAGTRTLEDVANVVVSDMVVALGARTGALAGRAPEGDALVLLRTVGFPAPVAGQVSRQALTLRTPLIECYVTREPVWLESRDGEWGLDARFPIIAPVWDRLGVRSAAFVPLVAAGETVGVIAFAFEQPRTFQLEERDFLMALGRQAALALERARLFDAEHAARAEAERANRAKSEFLAVMSHELRTPLNAIGGYAELMEMGIRGPITDPQREDLRRIQTSQRHLLGLINEVLNYAKLETGAVHYALEVVRVRDALAAAELLVAPQARARSLALDVAPCPPELAVHADAEKLRQILVNLLSNAVKFTDRGGRVELRCEAREEAVSIVVRDTGIGIAPDQLERIFEPFVQVRAELTRTAEGTGLGLAISRDLARGMEGDLMAESTPGEGSTFTLVLPRAR